MSNATIIHARQTLRVVCASIGLIASHPKWLSLRFMFQAASELESSRSRNHRYLEFNSAFRRYSRHGQVCCWLDSVANDPGCVKTLFVCYDSLVILQGKLMKRFVEQADRGQSTLLPECLDDFIDERNPVRVIDVFVDTLDLEEMGFDGANPAATGRPSYHPSVPLKLYIYGYLNRVQSSRRLEREAGRNVEVIWLLSRLAPDHKTIADFRKDNGVGSVRSARVLSSSAVRWAFSQRRASP